MDRSIILGAGIAGLTAASRLREAGRDVVIVDKGPVIGGRLATRVIGDAVIDHGAQFFTTRGEAFTEAVAAALGDGAVAEWCRGFAIQDGYPRYRGAAGMTSFAEWLGRDHSVQLNSDIERVTADDRGISFIDQSGRVIASGVDAVVTAPIPQMLQLFDRGRITLAKDLDLQLRTSDYSATLALLCIVDGAHAVDEPGGMQFDDGPFTFVADNRRKGISGVDALTFHAEHDYSLRRFDDATRHLKADLLELAAPWLGDASVIEAHVERWRYAGPVSPLPFATTVVDAGAGRIALAGDAFAGPKVEGAFNSGLAAAEALLA